MKITLTGAAGKLGSYVCRALVEAGHTVRAIDQVVRRDLPVPIEVGDLLDREGCYRFLEGSEAVVHLANHPNEFQRDAQRLLSENVTMNGNVFQAARELGIGKIVFASSIQAIGAGKKVGSETEPAVPYLPLDGDIPAMPTNSYGLSKQLSEEMLRYHAREAGMSCVAIRFPYLAHSQPQPGRFWRGVSTERINEGWSYLSLVDAQALIVAVMEASLPGFRIYYPAARANRAGRPVAQLIEDYFPGIPLKQPLKNIDAFIDISAIKADTGWEPKDEWPQT